MALRPLYLATAAFVMLGSVASAVADPKSCKELRPTSSARMSDKARARWTSSEYWERSAPAHWKKLIVSVAIDRAPHLVKAILEDCPGITVESTSPTDVRRFASSARLRITSFAALSRLVQLPAVRYVTVQDPSRPRKQPMPRDIFFD